MDALPTMQVTMAQSAETTKWLQLLAYSSIKEGRATDWTNK
jgi:hypothetical protein